MPTRRKFLELGALGGAALIIGVRWDDDAFAIEKPNASFSPNAWVSIDGSGKTYLTVGKSEMGQGAFFQDCSWSTYDAPYPIPAMETSYVRIDAPIPIEPWRAVFSPSSTFARECFIDELAGAAGKDPLEFRRSLLVGPDMVKAGSLQIDRRRLRRVLDLAAERSGWGTPLPAGRVRGLACNVYDGETHVAYVVEVSVPRDRPPDRLPFVVHRVVCAIDCGVIINPLGIEHRSRAAWCGVCPI
jgi:CO/xanthine dehydrogenase Mo-binding subunit